jgi:hypothetical protein
MTKAVATKAPLPLHGLERQGGDLLTRGWGR